MSSSRKYIIWEPFLLSIMVVLGMLIGYKMNSGASVANVATTDELTNMEEVLRYIDSKYVDKVNRRELQEAAIAGMLAELDPHTKYISPEEVQKINEEMDGEYYGIGVQWLPGLDSFLYAVNVAEGSPSQSAGIAKGDRLLSVDTFDFRKRKYSLVEVEQSMRGAVSSQVKISVTKPKGDTLDLVVERAQVDIPSLDFLGMISDSVGVIRLNRFSNKTYKEFMEAWEKLREEGMDDMIIDLRDNPGGYLQETVKILSQFIPQKNQLLVYTLGKEEVKKEYKSNGRIFHPIDDVVVLINENSASASEIMAGTLQDLDRGLVIGRRSYGKGLVQEQYDLLNGGAIRMTTARYYIPSGRLIQKDYDDTEDYHQELYQRELNGEWHEEEVLVAPDSTEFFTSSGRLVYGGGGVTPDVRTLKESPFSWPHENDMQLLIKQLAMEFSWNYLMDKPQDEQDYFDSYGDLSKQWEERVSEVFDSNGYGEFIDEEGERTYVNQELQIHLFGLWYTGSDAPFRGRYRTDTDIQEALELIREEKVDIYLGNQSATLE